MNDEAAAKTSTPKLDSATRLAYQRTYLAHERTQMGWVRTALSLISFGFVIAKFFELMRETHPAKEPLLEPRTVAILMIAGGLLALLFSDLQHRRALKLMREQCPGLPRSLAGITAAFIALLGILALLSALLRH